MSLSGAVAPPRQSRSRQNQGLMVFIWIVSRTPLTLGLKTTLNFRVGSVDMILLEAPPGHRVLWILLKKGHDAFGLLLEAPDILHCPVEAPDAFSNKPWFLGEDIIKEGFESRIIAADDEHVEELAEVLVDVLLAPGDEIVDLLRVIAAEDDIGANDDLGQDHAQGIDIKHGVSVCPLLPSELPQHVVGLAAPLIPGGRASSLRDRQEPRVLGLLAILRDVDGHRLQAPQDMLPFLGLQIELDQGLEDPVAVLLHLLPPADYVSELDREDSDFDVDDLPTPVEPGKPW